MPKATRTNIKDRIRQNAGWIAVVLVISSAMFVAGVVVGRGQAPITFAVDDLDVELEAERLQAEAEAQERYRNASNDSVSGTDLRFHEDLRTSRPERIPRANRPPAPAPARTTPPPERAQVRPEAPPLPAEGAWTLQVAAVRDGAAADRMVAKLISDGLPAFRTRVAITGRGEWFRVRVGRFSDRAAAASTQKKLERLGHRSFLIQNN